jgi:hypothetical protein
MSKMSLAGVAGALVLAWLTGCTNTVRPAFSAAEFLSEKPKSQQAVVLYVTEEFKAYTTKHPDPWDLKEWELVLGPGATDAMMNSFSNQTAPFETRLGQPQFPVQAPAGAVIVVPAFASFKGAAPVMFKFEDYKVNIGMELSLYDADGALLEKSSLTSKAKKQGSIGSESGGHSAFPEACRLALRDLAQQAVDHALQVRQGGTRQAANP